MRPKVISFDLDNTLCQYDQSPASILDSAFEEVGVDPIFDVEAYVNRFDEIASEAPDMATLRRRAFSQLAKEAGHDPTIGEAIAAAYTSRRGPGSVSWRSGMEAVFDQFSSAHQIVIVTNGLPDTQQQKLSALGIFDRIQCAIYCDGSIPRKPAPEPFLAALDTVDATPEQAVHIGDSLEHDVLGANRAELTSVWFPDPSWTHFHDSATEIEADHQVASAAELQARPWE